MYGDYNLVCPTMLFAHQYALHSSESNKFYSYRLVQPVTNGLYDCKPWMGVCHAMDLYYVFGKPIANSAINSSYSVNDYKLSKDIIQAWTAFAKYGNLSDTKMGESKVQWTEAFDWKQIKNGLQSHNLMWLDATNYKMVNGYFVDPCDSLYKKKIFT